MRREIPSYKPTKVLIDYIYDNVPLCMAPDFIGYSFPIPGRENYQIIMDIGAAKWSIINMKNKKDVNLTVRQYKKISKYLCKGGWFRSSGDIEPFEEFSESRVRINPQNVYIIGKDEYQEAMLATSIDDCKQYDDDISSIEYVGDQISGLLPERLTSSFLNTFEQEVPNVQHKK